MIGRRLRTLGVLTTLATLAMSSTLWAQKSHDPRRGTMAKLARPLSVDFTDARVEDVVEFLETVAQIDLEPLWIDDQFTEGLERDATVSISAKNVPVLSILERLLDKVQTEFEGNSWQLSETGAVEIGPKSRLNQTRRLEIYDIQDMLFEVRSYADVPELDLDAAIQQGGGGGGGGGGSIFEDTDEEQGPTLTPEDHAQQIIDLIIEFVEPEQWRDNGGDGGTITFYRGTLLIRAPDYMHRQLGGYAFWPSRLARSASARADDYARALARAERSLREQAARRRAGESRESEDSGEADDGSGG